MFSINSYRRVISAFLDSGYAIYPLGEEVPADTPRAVLLRHDIDYNLQAALQVAEANHALGVRACFCLQIGNVLYNLLEENNRQRVRRIANLGHGIGLHFSLPASVGSVPDAELPSHVEALIQNDMQLLAAMVDVPVQPVMSWHNPSVLGEEHAHLVSNPVSGLINAYALVAGGLAYASDSNHRFTIDEWLHKAKHSPERIHLLFHPIQWVHDSRSMGAALAGAWRQNIRSMEREFLTNHYYRRHFPEGLPEAGLDAWLAPLQKRGDKDA